ncbi:MAG TPA: DUF6264 family protein [Galbitalea sp.]|jgi:hypothetical protein
MPDDQPRPQYGEYATPEQQAAAMGREYSPPKTSPVSSPPPTPPVQAVQPQSLGIVLNRIITILFLAYGAIMFINDIPIYQDFAASFNKVLATAGNPTRVSSDFNVVGTWALVANVVLYLAAVALSFWQLRRGRLSFYIPVAGFVAFLLVLVILAITIGHFSPV